MAISIQGTPQAQNRIRFTISYKITFIKQNGLIRWTNARLIIIIPVFNLKSAISKKKKKKKIIIVEWTPDTGHWTLNTEHIETQSF